MGGVREYLRAENLAGGVFLTILDGALITGGEKQHLLVAHHLAKVVIEIAGLVGILHHKEQLTADFLSQGAECHRDRRGQ